MDTYDQELSEVVAFVLAMEELLEIVSPCDAEDWEGGTIDTHLRLRQAA